MTSKHALRAKARKLNIDIKILQKQLAIVERCLILQKQLAIAERCLQDNHTYINGTCIGCKIEGE